MNIVVFSYNFLPKNDAESFCTTRLASALAERGHSVHVVTERSRTMVSESALKQLLSPSVKVTYLEPLPTKKGLWRRICNGLKFDIWSTIALSPHIAALKKILLSEECPILLARCSPPRSLLVAHACRKFAVKFVAHFSDPYPSLTYTGFKWRLISWLSRRALSRVVDSCDKVSVTCEEAIRFFADVYGSVYVRNRNKFFVTTHVGEPKLLPDKARQSDCSCDLPTVTHCGYLSMDRYAERFSAEFSQGVAENYVLRLVGDCDPLVRRQLEKMGVPYLVDACSDPGEVTMINECSSVALVIDTKFKLGYSPYLPSKFAYLCFSSTPIVVYCQKGSCMHRISTQFPEAGVLFADVDVSGSLRSAIADAIMMGRISDVSRMSLRAQFSRKSVVASFASVLQ